MAAAPVRVRRTPGLRIPRRVSGPVRRPRHSEAPTPSRRRSIGIDRDRIVEAIVYRRLWIPMLGIALLGIVFMQVSMLSMNAGIGRSVKEAAALERENASLRAQRSRLSIGNSLNEAAAQAGMVVPEAGDYRVLTAGGGDAARRAAGKLTDPAPPVQASATTAPAATATGATSASTQAAATQAPATQTTSPAPQATTQTPTPAPQSQATQAASAPLVTTSGGGTAAPGP